MTRTFPTRGKREQLFHLTEALRSAAEESEERFLTCEQATLDFAKRTFPALSAETASVHALIGMALAAIGHDALAHRHLRRALHTFDRVRDGPRGRDERLSDLHLRLFVGYIPVLVQLGLLCRAAQLIRLPHNTNDPSTSVAPNDFIECLSLWSTDLSQTRHGLAIDWVLLQVLEAHAHAHPLDLVRVKARIARNLSLLDGDSNRDDGRALVRALSPQVVDALPA